MYFFIQRFRTASGSKKLQPDLHGSDMGFVCIRGTRRSVRYLCHTGDKAQCIYSSYVEGLEPGTPAVRDTSADECQGENEPLGYLVSKSTFV